MRKLDRFTKCDKKIIGKKIFQAIGKYYCFWEENKSVTQGEK